MLTSLQEGGGERASDGQKCGRDLAVARFHARFIVNRNSAPQANAMCYAGNSRDAASIVATRRPSFVFRFDLLPRALL